MSTIELHAAATAVASAGAMARSILVALGWGRTFYRRRHFKFLRFGATEALNLPEPLVLGIAGLLLWNLPAPARPGSADVAAAFGGAGLVVAGWVLIGAAFAVWPGMFAGHAIADEHRLITHGILRLVRHPSYAGAILIWGGLGIAYLHPVVCALTVVYVVPSYLLYIRSEEAMMRREFGQPYDAYRKDVPMLWPRLRRGRRGAEVRQHG